MVDEDEILRFAQDDIGIQDDIGMAHFLLAAIVAGGRDPSLRSGRHMKLNMNIDQYTA